MPPAATCGPYARVVSYGDVLVRRRDLLSCGAGQWLTDTALELAFARRAEAAAAVPRAAALLPPSMSALGAVLGEAMVGGVLPAVGDILPAPARAAELVLCAVSDADADAEREAGA